MKLIILLTVMTLIFRLADVQEENDGGEFATMVGREGKACDIEEEKHKSINIAQNAAMEAKAAQQAQSVAAEQASHQVKVQLAEKAGEAAKTAEAALLGKQSIVEEIEHELKEAKEVAKEEGSSLHEDKRTLAAATKASQAAQAEYKLLQQAIKISQTNVQNAELAVKGAYSEVDQKEKLVEAARMRVEELEKQLKTAREDLLGTRQAAEKAIAAAKEAKQNTERARRRVLFRGR
ncbi:hypothetical protein RI129_007394 [Pyrocoelia pectoralis]|uniref:Uncharacterized protein n=1 Tax=Pyrocoelia pectoralis TaxID=417401 RepID=A0AAN7VHR5_9COLE